MPNTKEDIDLQYTKLCAQLGQQMLATLAAANETLQRVNALTKERSEIVKQEIPNVQTKTENSDQVGSPQAASADVPA